LKSEKLRKNNITRLVQILYYPKHRIPIFPVVPGGKHPSIKNGFKSATVNISDIEQMHLDSPTANWAMRTGEKSKGGAGILIVDIDTKSGGFDTWAFLRSDHPEPIETIIVTSGGGGEHWWFLQPDGLDISCGTNVLGQGIDVRANKGYALVPPSITENPYQYQIGPRESEIAQLPDWILEKLLEKEFKPDQIKLNSGTVPQGERHSTLLSFARKLWASGVDSSTLVAALRVIRDEKFDAGDHPVNDKEIEDIVDWIINNPQSNSLADLGNAQRLVHLFGIDIRFNHDAQKWLIWDGRRWAEDKTGKILRFAFETIKSIYDEASLQDTATNRRKIAKWALQSENRGRIEATVALARSQPGIALLAEQLDQHTYLINCRNGVVDLRSGQLHHQDRDYFITKLTKIDFDPSATSPKWQAFLDLITGGDKELQEFLQVATGYSLTGETDEQCLFFLYGRGANGKSTFCEAIQALFSDYAARTDIEALMRTTNRGHGPSPYIAILAGTRFALASEIPEGKRLNESLIKDLTGGDSITARYLHANPFTFTPSHKLWLFGNYLPEVTGTDWGFWRRIRVIPFMTTIPEQSRRPMREVLGDFSREAEGILAWAVIGARKWYETGLPTTGAVDDATSTYKTDQDIVQQFIDECCEQHPSFSDMKSSLFQQFILWSQENNDRSMSRTKKWFTRQLTTRGFDHTGSGRSRLQGICLKNKPR